MNSDKNSELNLKQELEKLKIKYRYLQNEMQVLQEENNKNSEQYFVILAEMQAEEKKRRELEKKLHQSQKMEAIGLLAGGVAHDFNNQLTIIQGYSEIILNQLEKDNPIYNKIEHIANASDRAKSLTLQLLTFSQKQIVQTSNIDLRDILKDMENVLDSICDDIITLDLQIKCDEPFIKADPTQVQQVIMNLMLNARDSMLNGGKIKLILDKHLQKVEDKIKQIKPGEYITLSVQDEGTGIPENIKSKIFDPFFTTKEIGKGVGLGLPTAFGIIRQSNGFIDFESVEGRGSIFTVYFPKIEISSKIDMIIEEKLQNEKMIPKTVLLVEDEEQVRDLLSSALEMQDFKVLTAENGRQGLDVYKKYQNEIDIIISDLIMPDMSGEEMVNAIRQADKAVKVLFMSGYTADMIAEKGILKPHTHFIQKPFKLKKLFIKINKIFNK